MSFNYALEKKKFDAEWEKTEKEYIAAGMASEAIEEMRNFDWELFKRRRVDSFHEQSMIASRFDDDDTDDTQSALFEKFLDVMSTSDETSNHHSKYWWIEEIDNPELAQELLTLSALTIEALTLFAFEGWKQSEIAELMGCSQSNVAQKISTVKKIFKKYL